MDCFGSPTMKSFPGSSVTSSHDLARPLVVSARNRRSSPCNGSVSWNSSMKISRTFSLSVPRTCRFFATRSRARTRRALLERYPSARRRLRNCVMKGLRSSVKRVSVRSPWLMRFLAIARMIFRLLTSSSCHPPVAPGFSSSPARLSAEIFSKGSPARATPRTSSQDLAISVDTTSFFPAINLRISACAGSRSLFKFSSESGKASSGISKSHSRLAKSRTSLSDTRSRTSNHCSLNSEF